MKRRSLLFLSLVLSLNLGVRAQDAVDTGTERFRYYEDGPLSFNDFVKTYGVDEHNSNLAYSISIEDDKLPVRNSTPIFQSIPRAYMSPEKSWMLYDHADSATLHFNQVAFDIVEKYARIMNRELNGEYKMASTRTFYNHYYAKMQRELGDYVEATNYGTNTAAVEEYAAKIQQDLDKLPTSYPAWQPAYNNKWNIGMWVGWSMGFLSDEAAKLFTNPQCFAISWDNLFGRSRVFADITAGNSRVRNDFDADGWLWPEGTTVDYDKEALSYGYAVIDDDYFSVTPFAGIFRSGMTYRLDPKNASSCFYLRNSGITVGLEAEWKFKREHVEYLAGNALYGGAKSQHKFNEFFVKARLAWDNPTFKSELPGNTLSLSLALGFDVRYLK